MSSCQSIRKKKRKVCIGDMVDPIEIQSREIESPLFNTVDFDEDFEPINSLQPQILSLVETVTGQTYFDGVSTETPITHIIYIPFQENITAENWIIFEDRRIDILHVEDLDVRHQFIKLTCSDLGLAENDATEK